ncbi:hypothetical protein K443DRAFT_673267 [Laccaria amethystina LaAM-08-1]|uniref:Uncharacterized protein n=1 Tax=Laccaria amethystina LaAM-08-1 TaxID=1095629 RepID=A0A0C9X667_9AGAR|nr:hypothetical protein K443DRAFT_673267 [Laccaria amethystina LaAM-08-1]
MSPSSMRHIGWQGQLERRCSVFRKRTLRLRDNVPEDDAPAKLGRPPSHANTEFFASTFASVPCMASYPSLLERAVPR